MKKLTPIQLAQSILLLGYLRNFQNWPQSLPEMIANWEVGFFNRKSRKRDLTAVLNYLAETKKITLEIIEKSDRSKEVAFRVSPGA